MGRKRKYFTEEERKAAQREAYRRYRERHKDKIAKQKSEYYQKNKEERIRKQIEYYQNNKEKIAEYNADYWVKYRSTQFGRANNLLSKYRHADKLYNRGECTLTADWIVQNIFSQPCVYCGETDWHELGCDRIDNSLPHTPDNIVPCCYHCNCKKHTTPYDEYMRMIDKIA